MKNWNHLTLEQRTAIYIGLAHNRKAKQIAEEIGVSSSSVCREIKKHRTILSRQNTTLICPKIKRFPLVCNGCIKKSSQCGFNKLIYNAKTAEVKSIITKKTTRNHVTYTEEELLLLSKHIKEETSKGLTVYQSILGFKTFKISESNVYELIKKGKLTHISTKDINSPKKRKKNSSSYIYKDNVRIDRSNHTYQDFLKFIFFKNISICEMDFLGKSKGDPIDILALTFRHINYTILFAIKNKSSDKIVRVFDYLEGLLGTSNFQTIFSAILTDREPSFSNFEGICFNKDGELRTNLFYADPYRSTQKPLVENRNKLLRKYIPKKTNNKDITEENLKNIELSMNSIISKTLDRNSPKNTFIHVFGYEIYQILTNRKYII